MRTAFTSAGTTCAATHYRGRDGAPVVVLGHGLAGTQDSGLQPFAEAFAATGMHALTFDYRGFGASEGAPRQSVSVSDQVCDWHAAVEAAKALDGVDPQQVVLWGVSLSGGHVVSVAADRTDIAAVISAVPLVDGLATGAHALRSNTVGDLAGATGRGVASIIRRRTGRGSTMIPVVARPGEVGALTMPGAYEDYLAIAGPTWRNEIAADVVLAVGTRAPAKDAKRMGVPWLVQICDFDTAAPPYAAAKAAFAGRAEVRHYPGDHFDLFAGQPHHDRAVSHAIGFLTRHLSMPSAAAPDGEFVAAPPS